jgi:hypothetical protein
VDAPTAALIGAGLGFGGALFAAWLNPFTTARAARRAKQLELRREAYAAGLLAATRYAHALDSADVSRVLEAMSAAHASMRLVCSPDVAALYFDVITAVGAVGVHLEEHPGDGAPLELQAKCGQQVVLFVEAARADLGTDELYHRG